jgi:hypothetical protein
VAIADGAVDSAGATDGDYRGVKRIAQAEMRNTHPSMYPTYAGGRYRYIRDHRAASALAEHAAAASAASSQ